MFQYFSCLLLVVIFSPAWRAHPECPQSLCGNRTSDCLKGFPLNLSSHNTTVTLCDGHINIEKNVSIRDVKNITLQSLSDCHTNLVCTQLGVGFKLVNVTNLKTSSIIFDGCGLTLGTKEMDNTLVLIKVGLLILHCKNVNLYKVFIRNSAGCGLVLNQTSGMIQIVNI